MKTRILIFILSIFFLSCTSMSKKEKVEYAISKARFSKGTYFNEEYRLEITFDNDWVIFLSYNDFNNDQKEFFRYFSSPYDQILFIGFNEQYNIGVKCTNQMLGLENEDYLERLVLANVDSLDKYEYEDILLEERVYSNIEGIRLTLKITINKYNIFIFDSLVFKNKINNFKLDFWINEEFYEEKKDYIENIFSSIDFKMK